MYCIIYVYYIILHNTHQVVDFPAVSQELPDDSSGFCVHDDQRQIVQR